MTKLSYFLVYSSTFNNLGLLLVHGLIWSRFKSLIKLSTDVKKCSLQEQCTCSGVISMETLL